MTNVADDKGGEHEEQRDHREGSGSPNHFWRKEEGELVRRSDKDKHDKGYKFRAQ